MKKKSNNIVSAITSKTDKMSDEQVNKFAVNVNNKLGDLIKTTNEFIKKVSSHSKPDYDKHYSEIENAIMEWSRDGNKTAGTLTRKIIRILKKKK